MTTGLMGIRFEVKSDGNRIIIGKPMPIWLLPPGVGFIGFYEYHPNMRLSHLQIYYPDGRVVEYSNSLLDRIRKESGTTSELWLLEDTTVREVNEQIYKDIGVSIEKNFRIPERLMISKPLLTVEDFKNKAAEVQRYLDSRKKKDR